MDTSKNIGKDEALSAIGTLGKFCAERRCGDCELASVFTEMDAVSLTFRQRPYCLLAERVKAVVKPEALME